MYVSFPAIHVILMNFHRKENLDIVLVRSIKEQNLEEDPIFV
jgi:hypothetical protein